MICKKCGNEIKDGAKFCDNCGKKVKDNENKNTKINKQLLYIMICIIIIVSIGVGIGIGGKLFGKKDDVSNDTAEVVADNQTQTQEQEQEQEESKYVQDDDNVWIGKSFKDFDIASFKDNVIKLWFAGQAEYDNIKAFDTALFGEDYGKWLSFTDENGEPFEEIKTVFTKSGNLNGPWIPGKMIDIYYNDDKTAVYGISIYISDAYLGNIGRSTYSSIINEVFNCFPNELGSEIKSRYNSSTTEYKDFNVTSYENTINNERFNVISIMCHADEDGNNGNISKIDSTNKTDNSDGISPINKLRYNVKYKMKDINQNYIIFKDNTFEWYCYFMDDSDPMKIYFTGTYVESEGKIVLTIQHIADLLTNTGSDSEGIIEAEVTNDGNRIALRDESDEGMVFEIE